MNTNKDKQYTGYKFLPYTMQKLTDLDPFTKVENYSREININALKEDILRNIALIFMSKSHLQFSDLDKVNESVLSSVLFFGVRDYAGKKMNDKFLKQLKDDIVQQLKYFEPRLDPDTIEVALILKNRGSICEMEISSDIKFSSFQEQIKFKTIFNFETGLSLIEVIK